MTLLVVNNKVVNFRGYWLYKSGNVLKFNILANNLSGICFDISMDESNQLGMQFVQIVKSYILTALKANPRRIELDNILEMARKLDPTKNQFKVDIRKAKLEEQEYRFAILEEGTTSERLLKLPYPFKISIEQQNRTTMGYTRVRLHDSADGMATIHLEYDKELGIDSKRLKMQVESVLEGAYQNQFILPIQGLLLDSVNNVNCKKKVMMTFK